MPTNDPADIVEDLRRRAAALAGRHMRDPTSVKLDVDPDGALVTLEPGSWFVCFVPGLDKQWWHPFVNRRHVDGKPRYDGESDASHPDCPDPVPGRGSVSGIFDMTRQLR